MGTGEGSGGMFIGERMLLTFDPRFGRGEQLIRVAGLAAAVAAQQQHNAINFRQRIDFPLVLGEIERLPLSVYFAGR